jgi:hypothetical protein
MSDLESALILDPGCAAAAFNLTIELWQAGQKVQACEKWLVFLKVPLDRGPPYYSSLSASPPALLSPTAPDAPPSDIANAVSVEILRCVHRSHLTLSPFFLAPCFYVYYFVSTSSLPCLYPLSPASCDATSHCDDTICCAGFGRRWWRTLASESWCGAGRRRECAGQTQ